MNITAHVEKDIALEPVICSQPTDRKVPCYVDPRGGDFGVVLPQESYVWRRLQDSGDVPQWLLIRDDHSREG